MCPTCIAWDPLLFCMSDFSKAITAYSAPCVRCSRWKCQAWRLSGYIKNLLLIGEIPHPRTFASINQRLRQPGLLNAQNMAVDGEGLSALRYLRKRSRMLLMTLPHLALADLGNPYTHTCIYIYILYVYIYMHACRTVVWQVMRINNGCTGTMDINVRQRAQRITPGDTNLGSGFYNAVFRSHGSIALFSGTWGILYSTQ